MYRKAKSSDYDPIKTKIIIYNILEYSEGITQMIQEAENMEDWTRRDLKATASELETVYNRLKALIR